MRRIKVGMVILSLLAVSACAPRITENKTPAGLHYMPFGHADRDVYLTKMERGYQGNDNLAYLYMVLNYKQPKEIGKMKIRSSKSKFIFDCSTQYKFALVPPVLYETTYAQGEAAFDAKLTPQWQVLDDPKAFANMLWTGICKGHEEMLKETSGE